MTLLASRLTSPITNATLLPSGETLGSDTRRTFNKSSMAKLLFWALATVQTANTRMDNEITKRFINPSLTIDSELWGKRKHYGIKWKVAHASRFESRGSVV